MPGNNLRSLGKFTDEYGCAKGSDAALPLIGSLQLKEGK
jgi:hypothetical protein